MRQCTSWRLGANAPAPADARYASLTEMRPRLLVETPGSSAPHVIADISPSQHSLRVCRIFRLLQEAISQTPLQPQYQKLDRLLVHELRALLCLQSSWDL